MLRMFYIMYKNLDFIPSIKLHCIKPNDFKQDIKQHTVYAWYKIIKLHCIKHHDFMLGIKQLAVLYLV
jgi:hypothetical protein